MIGQVEAHHDPTLTDFEVRVLDGYLWHSDDSGSPVWPAVGTVTGKVHGEPRSVRRCVAQLKVARYMERFLRSVEHQRNRSNMYYFREPARPLGRSPPQPAPQMAKTQLRSPDPGDRWDPLRGE